MLSNVTGCFLVNVGDRGLVQVCIATLASDRALMLTGEPATAKSWLSEHLSAAIGATSSAVKRCTVSRIASAVSPRPKSNGGMLLGIMNETVAG